MSGQRFAAAISLLALFSISLTSVAQIPLAPPSAKGQTVTPVFEGWYRNPDGTYSLSFGYFNRNFEEMVENLEADAVLVTQLVSIQSAGSMADMNPQKTLNLRPTNYWRVFIADVTEYVEPQAAEFEHSLVLLTELHSVLNREAVWGIQSSSDFKLGFDRMKDISFVTDEAKAIARYLSRDGLIDK